MTTEERLNRIEHFTAAEAEQRRQDREENRQLWRDTQRQLDQLTANVNNLTIKLADTNDHLAARIDQLAEESRQADARLAARMEAMASATDQRIANLVSGMGDFIAKLQPPTPKR